MTPLRRDGTRLLVLLLLVGFVLAGIPPFLPEPDLIVAGWELDEVLQYDPDTGAFVSGFVAGGAGTLDGPHGLRLGPDGHLYAVSFFNNKVLKFDGGDGSFLGEFVSSGLGGLDGPMCIEWGPDGNAYVASFNDGAVYRYNGATGAFIDAFIPSGLVPAFSAEWLEFMPSGNLLVAAGPTLNTLVEFDGSSGAVIGAFMVPGDGGLLDPHGFVFGPDGNLYVASFQTDEVLRYNGATGAFIDAFASAGSGGLTMPHHMAFGPDGHLYVASWGSHEVLRYNGATGAFIDAFVTTSSGGLLKPQSIIFRDANPWTDLGNALAGTNGEPQLQGDGSLEALTPGTLTVDDLLENTNATLYFGFGELNAPFKGGIFVPVPTFSIVGLPTGPSGSIVLPFLWPGGIPPGFEIIFQIWLTDAAGPVGFAASNGLKATTP